MNGAESLVRTLVASGVETCFANPGTSEMHFVAALDRVPGIRCVLGLFEGVVTGAADGYWRLAQRPAATLLHLGPGLANGVANLHNARKASSGIVNVIGEHATHHLQYDAPLTSDIEGLARPSSHWVKTSPDAKGMYHANDEGDEKVNDIVEAIREAAHVRPSLRHVPLTEARKKMGTYADALALDQKIRSPRARALGWTPTLRSVAGNVGRLFEEYRRATSAESVARR